eukprot:CAMPEP_0181125202 /NCGR_PEP_ID=MMETSP1071-20121207/26909_1 /TAXON_ID=35127 /ORGANISM="Thalassiosira sp., Strain NH16" /LENGTH=31 /DNA_ID= /DNA_START= /DNA_END= /DNA_ORIENTATION=
MNTMFIMFSMQPNILRTKDGMDGMVTIMQKA